MRVGLLGGTFNPPHIGHLVCAQEARAQLGLDRVELVPVATPPHKVAEGDPGAEHRLAMCRAAVADDPALEVNDVEVRRGGPSYTADTLRALDGDHDLTFIVGGDMAYALPQWREPETILSLAELGVAERAETRRQEIEERLAAYDPSRIRFFSMPRIDLSSSDVRARVAEGRPVRYLVPAPVADYIEREGLYA